MSIFWGKKHLLQIKFNVSERLLPPVKSDGFYDRAPKEAGFDVAPTLDY